MLLKVPEKRKTNRMKEKTELRQTNLTNLWVMGCSGLGGGKVQGTGAASSPGRQSERATWERASIGLERETSKEKQNAHQMKMPSP